MEEKSDELFGLEIAIDKIDETLMSNGDEAFIIYLKIDNKTPKSRKINPLKATYVTNKREQLEQDVWLNGYIIGEDTLKPNSFKKAGLVFYKPKLKQVSNNDVIYITIKLIKEGIKISLCFKKNGKNWTLVEKDSTEIELKLSPKQLEKKLLNRIERLDAFEERMNVSIEKISVKVDNISTFSILGELHSNYSTELEESLEIVCVLY